MVVDLPAAYVGIKQVSSRSSRLGGTGLSNTLSVLIEGRTKVALEREWRLTMALALKQLPSGSCLTIRDGNGREWYIGPVTQAKVRAVREAA